MKYGHAVLGESFELYKEAAEWGRDQKMRIERNERARAIILDSLEPMIEEKKKVIAGRQVGK